MNRNFRNRYQSFRHKPDYDRNDGLPGVVYILHNEAMRPGIYKIGQSTRSGAARANDLNRRVGTETPKLFKCIFEFHTVDCGRAEKAVHLRLHAYRMTRQEYFDVDLELAKSVIKDECAKQVPAPAPQPKVVAAPPIHTPTVQSNLAESIDVISFPPKQGLSQRAIFFWVLAAIIVFSLWPSKTRVSNEKQASSSYPAFKNSISQGSYKPPNADISKSETARLMPSQPRSTVPSEATESNASVETVQEGVAKSYIDITGLSREEISSLEAACSRDKYQNGPAAYNSCKARQLSALSKGTPAPDVTGLSREEVSSLEAACSRDKYQNGPAAYNSCKARQLSALSKGTPAPDVTGLSREEISSLEAACSRDKYQNGPAAYNSCKARQLSALRR